ncbi:small-conductance mechanosensitive channel [Stenotrophomonas rhizophila]|jgi:small-conductance mechanosensitive channel|uniref:Small-conductance mechanosensitive channel n=1 Tax=Stenotrophomonas rhizophila TaxID=216778 RepID=A0AAP5AJ69_9GAMM|nr:mechanosensitive ion channel family protein [Stenotrophomonas rhizophila]MDQ1109679.1 small-conductance mechanosensitive channel [Stenotrophomonas rhizophila]
MHVDWQTAAAYLWPIGIALAIGLTGWWALMLLTRRLKGRDYRRARIARVISRPLAFALPMLVLIPALEATPLDGRWLDQSLRLLHIGLTACFIWLLVRAVAAGEQAILRDHPMEVADNLAARRIQTQTRVLSRVLMGAIILVGASMVLLTFPMVRQIGTALLASAGIIGLVAGIAAKPVFGNLIAGLQIALTQPIRLDDVVIVEGEWGRVEEIGSSYVVVRIWDERRMVVPLTWFIENPFQNWTRRSADLLGTAFLWLDYRAPIAAIRTELERICKGEALWDGRVCVTQVTETTDHTLQVRLLVSARNSGDAFDLRCIVRERMLDFLAREHPQALPRTRAELLERPDPPTRTPRSQPADDVRSPGAEDGPPAVVPVEDPAVG